MTKTTKTNKKPATKAKPSAQARPSRKKWAMPALERGDDDETFAPEIAQARKIEETAPCNHCRKLAGRLIDMYESNDHNEESVARAYAGQTALREVLFQIARINKSLGDIRSAKFHMDEAISKYPELEPYERSPYFRNVDKAIERLDGVIERRAEAAAAANA